MSPLHPYTYIYGKPQLSIGVRRYGKSDAPWAAECDRLALRVRADLGLDTAPSHCNAAAALVSGLLAEFAQKDRASHVFEIASNGKPFSAIGVCLDLLPDPEAAAVIICGFAGKQISALESPDQLPPSPETFRAFQSALFLAFLAGWANRRGLSGKLRLAATILAKASSMVQT